MQIKSLRLVSYRSWKIDDRGYSEDARERCRKLQLYGQLRLEGCCEKTALAAVGLSRATYYRLAKQLKERGIQGLERGSRCPKQRRSPQWNKGLEQQVLALRRRYPLWGKAKLAAILQREYGCSVSESTVGRILSKLKASGKIKPAYFYWGRAQSKRARAFHGHSTRWHARLKATTPGEMIQIDHMKVYPQPGYSYAHFKATCPLTKLTFTYIYRRATSANAAHFLTYIQHHFSFPIRSIQVDGGSEFREDFEKLCQQQAIALFVLPPRSPEKKWASRARE